MKVRDRIDVITDLLLGAVHADEQLQESEQNAVRRLLADLLLVDKLPEDLERRIREFDPRSFAMDQAAQDFAADPPMSKRRLLELVGQMCHADGVLDLDEDAYVRNLGRALGMSFEEYSDLVLDYEIEELRENLRAIRMTPMPFKAVRSEPPEPPSDAFPQEKRQPPEPPAGAFSEGKPRPPQPPRS